MTITRAIRHRYQSWRRRLARRRFGIMPGPHIIDCVVGLPPAELVDGVWETTR